MNEPWTTNYRGLAIVPMVNGDADAGYAACYKIDRTDADGTPIRVAEGACDGRYDMLDQANEAAGDAARAAIDRLLDDAAGST